MSAIFGILRFDGAVVSTGDLERMSNVLAHRGRHGRKFAVDGSIGLGHCLMRVNKEDFFEAQPLRDREADLTLVADCRIDNREELAGIFDIDAAELRNMPDSALVLRAFKKWDEACAEHLIGDFAFAVWDGRAKKLVLGRDHMGQRCIHYHRGNGYFAFATEVKALWALPEVPRELNETQIARFLLAAGRQPQPGVTFFNDIFTVLGGAMLTLGADGTLAMRRYWEPGDHPVHRQRDEAYYVETYRHIFAEAVECRVRRLIDPPALCLSGGYDSAAIAALCGPVLQAQGRKLVTISSVLPEDYQGSLADVRRSVELCRRDMPHLDVRYFVRRNESMFTDLEKAFYAEDGIPFFTDYVSRALFHEASRAGSRLIMDGILGDETINPRGRGALAYYLRAGKWRRFIDEFGPHRRATGGSFWHVLRRDILSPLAPFWARRAWHSALRGFAPPWSNRSAARGFVETQVRTGSIRMSDFVGEPWPELGMRAQMLRLLGHWQLHARRAGANSAAANGLELTRPLADKRVVEFGLSVPEGLYVKNGRNRYLACRALADLYPLEYQTRGRQQELPEPDILGMLGAARPLISAAIKRLSASSTVQRYVDFDRLKTCLANSKLKRGPRIARDEIRGASLARGAIHRMVPTRKRLNAANLAPTIRTEFQE